MRKVLFICLVLGLTGCTSVTKERIKSVIQENRDKDDSCTVIVLVEDND